MGHSCLCLDEDCLVVENCVETTEQYPHIVHGNVIVLEPGHFLGPFLEGPTLEALVEYSF